MVSVTHGKDTKLMVFPQDYLPPFANVKLAVLNAWLQGPVPSGGQDNRATRPPQYHQDIRSSGRKGDALHFDGIRRWW